MDTTPPETTDDADSTWTGNDVYVTLTAVDTGSSVAATYYCVDHDGTCNPNLLGAEFLLHCVTGNVCERYVRYYSVDEA